MEFYNDAETLKIYNIDDNDLSDLDKLALKHGTDKSPAGHWYTKHYSKYLEKIRYSNLNILEIGVHYGCSVNMWNEYFPNSTIYGLDIVEDCKKFENNNIKIIIGDCTDSNIYNKFNDNYFDIIIDDGSHYPEQILINFQNYFNKVKYGGIYFIEDLFFSSYNKDWREFFIKLHDSVCLPNFIAKSGQWLVGNRERAINYIESFPDVYNIEDIYKNVNSFELQMNFLSIRKSNAN